MILYFIVKQVYELLYRNTRLRAALRPAALAGADVVVLRGVSIVTVF